MSNAEKIQVLFLLLFVFTFVIGYLLHVGRKQIEEKQKYSIFRPGKKGKTGSIYYKLYDFLVNWILTKRYIQSITRQYEIVMPGDKKRIAIKTVKTALLIWLIDAAAIILLFALKPSFYKAILTIAYIYLINNHTLGYVLGKSKTDLLKQTDKLIGDVRHNYQNHEMVDEAMYETIENLGYPIKLHAIQIHSALNADDIEEEISKYNDTVPNRFLKIFSALCVTVMKFGDKKIEKQSLFLTNLRYLRQEISIEVVNREKIQFLFSGLVFIAAIPILFLKAIQDWAIQCFSGLKNYYYGAFGIASMAVIFVITLVSYQAISRLKETNDTEVKNYVLLDWLSNRPGIKAVLDNIINKNYGRTLRIQDMLKQAGESITAKQFLFKRILYAWVTFICCIILAFSIHGSKRIQILTDTSSMDYFSSMVSDKQIDDIKIAILTYVSDNRYKSMSVDEVQDSLLKSGVIKSKELATMTANEIVTRINRYQYQYFKWYELVISFIASVVAYYMPYIIIVILKKMRQMAMEDEVIQFHSIILMLMYMDRMNVETILTWLENFSVIFKKSIQECINDLPKGEIEALEELKRKESYVPFVRLIENLQLCDKISVEKAFDEIAVERYNFQENRKLENEVYTKNKTTLATAIAWLPFITTGMYLIIPWIIESMSQLINYLDQMNGIF